MKQFWVTFLASAFRSIRFGLNEAHGRGQAVQLNYLIDHGGFVYDDKMEKFGVDFNRIAEAVQNLTNRILILQGDGVKSEVENFVNQLGVNRDYTKKALGKLKDVPVDIGPIFYK